MPETVSVQQLRNEWRSLGLVTAGQLIEALLHSHDDYVDEAIRNLVNGGARLASRGPVRAVDDHLDSVQSHWDEKRAPMMSGRHVILGLALDPAVGWGLLLDGVIGSLLSRWRPGLGTDAEPHRLVWDALSVSGRQLAEEQPLLAAALGAPAETTMTLPAPVRALAWSPGGDRLAVLAGDTVYETRPGSQITHPIGEFGETVRSIGWGGHGVVGLAIDGSRTELLRVDGSSLGGGDRAVAGVLSGDGSHAWLQMSDGVHRWAPTGVSTTMTGENPSEPAIPVALDWTGYHGLLLLAKSSVLVVASPPGSLPGLSVDRDVNWPSDAAPMIGWGPPLSTPCALVRLGRGLAAAYTSPDGVDICQLMGTLPAGTGGSDQPPVSPVLVSRITTGLSDVSALAADSTGTQLAVAAGAQVAVWPLGQQRLSATPVPAYDTDRPDGTDDLLDADRDARAIAALVSASNVRPPLSLGLFGAWGSGKSFILQQLVRLLAATDRPDGYLRDIRVVEFNAWQYAETNLWASLVDQVLRVIAPVQRPEPPSAVAAAQTRAAEASAAKRAAARDVDKAKQSLEKAKAKLATQRKRAAWLGVAILVLAAVAIAAVLLGAVGKVVAAVSAALALLSAAAGLLARAKTVKEQAKDIADAGQLGLATIGRLLGRPEELAVQASAAELRTLEERHTAAIDDANRLATTRDEIEQRAEEQPLGALLDKLATISEYRDQLSLVTRTREHFCAVDNAIRDTRERDKLATTRPDAAVTEGKAPQLDRVVIVIDDLDRCPPEKVVSVLEAVHLLFSFEMFVVVMAVDTRWLEQSLRVRYPQLLGGSAAAPTDYLEKIIQIPLHLTPLDESKVGTMIAGLARATPDTPPPPHPPEAPEPTPGGTHQPAPLTAKEARTTPKPLPPEIMQVTVREATAMSSVAALVGTTPRLVKRFVNTYRLLKARYPDSFDEHGDRPDQEPGNHDVAAFLLAVVTGHPATARPILTALQDAVPEVTVEQALTNLAPQGPPTSPATMCASLATIREWLATHRSHATAPAQRYAHWVNEASRFSFHPVPQLEVTSNRQALRAEHVAEDLLESPRVQPTDRSGTHRSADPSTT